MSTRPTVRPAAAGGAGMGRAAWLAHQRGRKAVLYLIKLYGNDPEPAFYKLGITFDIGQRFARLRFAGYKWRTVARFSSYNAGRVYDLEAKLHGAGFVPYAPLLGFSGDGECYADCGPLLAALPAKTFILRNQETDI